MALKKNSRRTGIGSAVKSLGSAVTSSVKSQAQKAGVTGSSGGSSSGGRVSQDIRDSSTAKGAALGSLATGGSALGSLAGGIVGAISSALRNNGSGTGGSTHWSPSQSTGSSGIAGSSGYIPFDPSGNDYAGMAGMSSIDRAALAAAGAAWNQANARGDQAAKDAAHAQAEAIRSRYAYSGGGDGSQYIPTGNNYTQELNQLKAQLEEVAAQKPQYSGDKYDTSSIIDQLTGMDYADWTKSDQYKALADRYGAQGQMSMQDVLGQISSRTGGLASSYAATAAQQQYNDYMAQLEEIARQMYSGDRRDLIENLGVMNDANSVGYNRYLNELGQYNTDYSNLYNQYRDLIGDSQWNQNFQYQQNRDSISDKRYDQEYADSRSDYADSQTATSKADAQNRINAYAAEGVDLTYEQAMDEVAADRSGRMINDEAALDDFIEKHRDDRTLLQKVRDAIRALVSKLTGAEKKKAQTAQGKLTAALEAAAKQAESLETNKNAAQTDGEARFSIKRTAQMTLAQQLKMFYDGKMASSDAFYFGVTPAVLEKSGFDALPLAMTIGDFRKSTQKKHNIPRRVLKNLMGNLASPLFSFGSGDRAGIVLNDIDGDGYTLLAALERGTDMDRKPVNVINSLYGLEHPAEWIKNQIDSGNEFVLYDEKRANAFLQTYGYMASVGDGIRSTGESVTQNGAEVKTKFSLKTPVEETDKLLALHNKDENSILAAIKLGGLPMPSIAIVKARDGHTKYGPISLVFSKDTIDPQLFRANKVYGGDAWTPTAPRVDYPVNSKKASQVEHVHHGGEPGHNAGADPKSAAVAICTACP